MDKGKDMKAKEMKEMKEPMKKPARLVKGSPAAKEFMASLRDKKVKK